MTDFEPDRRQPSVPGTTRRRRSRAPAVPRRCPRRVAKPGTRARGPSIVALGVAVAVAIGGVAFAIGAEPRPRPPRPATFGPMAASFTDGNGPGGNGQRRHWRTSGGGRAAFGGRRPDGRGHGHVDHATTR